MMDRTLETKAVRFDFTNQSRSFQNNNPVVVHEAA